MFPEHPIQKPLRVGFFGTPEFAATCLQALIDSQFNVVGAVTAPDKKAGRGQHIKQSDVKQLADIRGIQTLQPQNLKSPAFLSALNDWSCDVFIVVAFRMLPESVWNAPPYGSINLHASLLPQLRGAAPIQWAIMHGLKKTGITTFSLQHEIDAGDILMQEEIDISNDETAASLHDKLLDRGKELVIATLNHLAQGKLRPLEQKKMKPSPLLSAPKLNSTNTRINWSLSAESVRLKVNALYPFPKAWTPTPFGDFKVQKVRISEKDFGLPNADVGTSRVERNCLFIKCADGWVEILELTPPGKRAMSGGAWLNGLNTAPGIWGV